MLLSAAILILAPGVLAGMYGKPVINLDAKTFKQAMSVEHASMVAFVAPWCGHCKALAPEYTSAAASLSPLIPFYAVDCDDAANKALCGQYEIKGFPTIKAFPRALKGAAKDYAGGRKAEELVEYAKSLVPDRVKKLRVSKDADGDARDGVRGVVEGWLKEKKELPHVLLIHPTQPSIPFLWKVLSHRLSTRASMGYVRDTPDHGIIASLGVYNTSDGGRDPVRAVYWPKGAKRAQLVEYEGAFKFNALLEWVTSLLDANSPPPPERDLPTAGARANAGHKSAGSAASADTDKSAGAGSSAAEAEAERRAKLKLKMEEAERRDQKRRDKLAAAKAAAEERARVAALQAADVAADSDSEDGEEQGSLTVQQEQADTAAAEDGEAVPIPATPVDAPKPQAEESVEEEMLAGQSPPIGVPQEPEAVEGVEEGLGEEARETRVHEEL